MKDGIDAKRLLDRLKPASPMERRELTQKYIAWIFLGAKAQGWRGGVGLMALGSSALLGLESAIYEVRSIWIYVIAAFGICIGFLLARAAFRRERDWRRENPFPH